ncbi:MAG: HAD-IC family P-type ATPase [Chloroflexota bacterium]|nr:HAD-IC family P-type ATPase [Dehalococcoidia bacterium]MDW8254674.1 HAD-IC family P-type ATPase [Chloroflexota bacterium]
MTLTRDPDAPPEASLPPHALEASAVLAAFASSLEGLRSSEAERRRARYGANVLAPARGDGVLHILWRQINNPLVFVLLGAAALAIATGKGIDGAVVLAVVVVNAIIGFVQEYRAGKAIAALSAMTPDTATVLRDGEKVTVPAAELVPGDIVLLQSGDRVPADVRLVVERGLRVEEAALTGESVPAEKETAPLPPDTPLGDRRNMAFAGTYVTSGVGTAVVVATGMRTELGRISAMLRETTEIETPLTKQIAAVSRWITVAILIVSALLFATGLLRGYPAVDAILAAITLAVGAIPEGLPAVITIVLAIGVRRMAARRAIVRRLAAVETLGSATVICSDKTGTLTRNEMMVQHLWAPSGHYRLTGTGYAPEGALLHNDQSVAPPDDVAELARAGALCSDSTVQQKDGKWVITGDPTEAALEVAARKILGDVAALRRDWPRLDAIPFESERKFMATLHATPSGGQVIYLKGAPEVVLQRAARDGAGAPLDAAQIAAQVEALAAQGLRVLALAAKVPAAPLAALSEEDVAGGFVFLGLQGLIDPPRPEAIAAVAACHGAGITVKMITGDHASTALAIGRQLGLADAGDRAVTGAELERLSDDEMVDVVRTANVFARVAPEHKLRLVRALQRQGEVVAMTGDGVNDAPALKQADIGVAMGITGTDVSKEAADIVLADDNFATIAAAVEEGRRAYDNLVKSLAFILPTNLAFALIFLVAVVFFPIEGGNALLPMLPTQLLWINLVSAVTLALPLAVEAMEPDIMRRPPRRPDAPVFNRFVAFRTVLVALLIASGTLGLFLVQYFSEVGIGIAPDVALREAQTMAVTAVTLFQVFYLLQSRSLRDSIFSIGLFSNPWVYVGIGVLLALQAGFIYLPVMNVLFGTAPLSLMSLLEAVLVAFLIVPVITVEKAIASRLAREAA